MAWLAIKSGDYFNEYLLSFRDKNWSNQGSKNIYYVSPYRTILAAATKDSPEKGLSS